MPHRYNLRFGVPSLFTQNTRSENLISLAVASLLSPTFESFPPRACSARYSQKSMLRTFTAFKLTVALAISFILSTGMLAQSRRASQTDTTIKQLTRGKNASRRPDFNLSIELRRQQRFLSDVATRYEAVSVHDLTPQFSYTYVWNALRENRTRLVDPRRRLKPDQVILVREAYELLETDVVLRFLEHQLGRFDETLQLDESQYGQVEKILTNDLQQKRALLSVRGIDSRQFLQRLQIISSGSEKNILLILSAEQRKNFYKQIDLTRARLVA